jgi:predicted nucleic acid-binding protein
VNNPNISRVYVIDSSVAFYGGAGPELFAASREASAVASAWFLARAAFHGATLHIPSVFYTEVSTYVARDVLASGALGLADSTSLLEDILSTAWDMHIAVFADVLEIQQALGHLDHTSDAEYLAVALGLGCTIITADEAFKLEVQAKNIDVPVMLVTDHPWASPGSLEDFPPTD